MRPETLVVYSREGCHLCDELLRELRRLVRREPVSIEVVDVDLDPGLRARYGDKVPVVESGGTELCRYFFDAERVRGFLSQPRSGV